MRVRLRGVNRVTKRLSDGSTRTYWYAWKGGPALKGEPGSPEFAASYAEAASRRQMGPEGKLLSVLNRFQASADFDALAPRTRADYKKHIRAIETEFGDMPLSVLDDRRTRGELLAWRDKLGTASRRNADYRFAVLARILAWAVDRGLATHNPCERPGRLYQARRKEMVWTDADEAAFLARAPKHLHLALLLALWTGQRQGDLLRLTWFNYDGTHLRLRQQKTGKRVVIPAGAPLRAALDAIKADEGPILRTIAGTRWTESGFRASWRTACIAAKVTGVTFHDLRGTAVTRLKSAGATIPEIAQITGHSLATVTAILDSHYMGSDMQAAENAIAKLEKRTKTPN
jgi:integrase